MKPWLLASLLLVEVVQANPLSFTISVYQADGAVKEDLPRNLVDKLDENKLLYRLTAPVVPEQKVNASSTMGNRSLSAEVKTVPLKNGSYRMHLNLGLMKLRRMEGMPRPLNTRFGCQTEVTLRPNGANRVVATSAGAEGSLVWVFELTN